jgi:hypothetical protein
VLYPLELKQNFDCTLEQNSGEKYDPRFINTGLAVTEFSMQNKSGVLEELRAQPLYE